jgi:hypothetical protein
MANIPADMRERLVAAVKRMEMWDNTRPSVGDAASDLQEFSQFLSDQPDPSNSEEFLSAYGSYANSLGVATTTAYKLKAWLDGAYAFQLAEAQAKAKRLESELDNACRQHEVCASKLMDKEQEVQALLDGLLKIKEHAEFKDPDLFDDLVALTAVRGGQLVTISDNVAELLNKHDMRKIET